MSAVVVWQSYLEYMKDRGSIEDIMIISSETGQIFATSNANFVLKEYKALITQEDGSEIEETVNEANNLVKFMKGQKPAQGLRINGTKKQQITRNFNDEVTNLVTIYGKYPQGGSCVANGGKCIIVATFSENLGHTSPDCNETVTLMARYLTQSTWPTPGGKSSGNDNANNGNISAVGTASWQQYIDLMLIGKGNVGLAMICSMDGAVLASTPDFKLKTYETEIPQEDGTDRMETVDETKNILSLVKGSKPSQGLRVNQQKYQIIRSLEEEHSQCFTAMGGLTVANCKKCIIIATYDEAKGHTAIASGNVIADLAKFLKNNL
eukprot:gene13536-18156_t